MHLLGLLVFLGLSSIAMADVIIPIPMEFKPCQNDKECIKIEETSCSSCCDEGALNRDSSLMYQQLFQKICPADKKKPCTCKASGTVPKCIEGSCQLEQVTPTPAPQLPLYQPPPSHTAAP